MTASLSQLPFSGRNWLEDKRKKNDWIWKAKGKLGILLGGWNCYKVRWFELMGWHFHTQGQLWYLRITSDMCCESCWVLSLIGLFHIANCFHCQTCYRVTQKQTPFSIFTRRAKLQNSNQYWRPGADILFISCCRTLLRWYLTSHCTMGSFNGGSVHLVTQRCKVHSWFFSIATSHATTSLFKFCNVSWTLTLFWRNGDVRSSTRLFF